MSLIDADTVIVQVTNPEHPFGGVIVMPPGSTTGGEGSDTIGTVFGREGDIVPMPGDYSLDQIAEPLLDWVLEGGIRIKNDNSFQIWNPDQSKWHTIQVRGDPGEETISIGSSEA